MSERTEQEKLERRRQKRQQKILASSGDRLNKITGTAYPGKITPTPSPSVSVSSFKADSLRAQSRSRSPSPAVVGDPAPSTSTESLKRRSSDADPGEDLGAPLPVDPFQIFASAGPFGIPRRSEHENLLHQNLNDQMQNQFPFNPAIFSGMQQQQTEAVATTDTSEKYWKLLHLISMFWLGAFAVYTEWTRVGTERFASLLFADSAQVSHPGVHVPVFWYFITIELCLQSARILYHKGGMSSSSTLGALAAYLPPPFGDIVIIFLRYRLIWSCLVQDCCVLVFVIGLAEIVSYILNLY